MFARWRGWLFIRLYESEHLCGILKVPRGFPIEFPFIVHLVLWFSVKNYLDLCCTIALRKFCTLLADGLAKGSDPCSWTASINWTGCDVWPGIMTWPTISSIQRPKSLWATCVGGYPTHVSLNPHRGRRIPLIAYLFFPLDFAGVTIEITFTKPQFGGGNEDFFEATFYVQV